ncbi:hypothetical protein ACH4TV_37435 [Streptomyces sp. NPDC020898]|uniref:hypothetical protein n=1 Tax=Streptomyces sp. NPDC020898 TaxID=3365101 RepID=UPI0037A3BC15
MEDKNAPDTATASGLSTDDLARPRPQDPSTREGPASMPTEVPTFPGESTDERTDESTDTPGPPAEDEAPEADSGTRYEATDPDIDADARTRTHAEADAEDEALQLLAPEDEEGFRSRWQEVQNEFVDDPRDAVHAADALVADVMQQLATTFADHKQELEGQWNRGEQANTEDLRLALRHYRSFFNRLLVT